jgi:Leucine-rich repeat (LRR) protein
MSNNYFNSTESQAFGKNFTYLKYLRLSENSFESLERESFLFLPNLEVLDLSSNKIDTIEPGSFVGLDSLRVLVLVNLNLETVNDKQTFYGLVKLEQLNMSKNRISNLSDKVFSSLESLKLLKLEANKLEVLSRHVFDGLLNLVELSLVQNLFEKLENYSFSVLTRVSTLRLNYNIIKDIESNAFYGINNSLASLDISFNKLQFVRKSHFNSLTKLVELVLVNNQISSIEAGSFANLINLEILDLEDNSLFRIESLLFVSLIKLRVLILTKNVIQELKQDSFQYMQNLNELILKENVITTLNSGIFKRLLRLKILDLSDNLINEIDFMCFDGLDNLEQLYMDNVKQYVNIKPARGFKLLPVLTTLQLTNATIQLIRQFDMANLTIINFELAELDMATIQKLPTNKLEQISLKNIRFNGKVDSALMPFGESLITIDLSGNVLSNKCQSLLLNRSINVEGLGLSNCNGLNNLSIDYFFNLTDLDLSWGMIRSIDSFLNQNLYLQTLDLSHNFLTQIGVDDFHGLESLNYLNLSFNMIDKVEEFSFRDLISIITLDMSNNRIKFLDQNSLGHNHFDNIKLLVLSNNSQLNTIGFNVYSSSLTVDLVNCGFDHVPSQKFINDPVIEFFNLSNNRISRVNKTDFQNSKSIVQLKLSGNAINSVDFDSFHSLNQLNILDLSRNNLTELHNETFKGLLYLEYLNISFNQIAVINTKLFFELAKLKSLDLSHNLIKTIDQFVFLTNHELKFLFLHHNPLTDFFANETLEGLDSIKFIYIGSPVKISMNSCEIIKLMLSAFEVEKKGAIAYYDAVDILTRTDGEGTDDRHGRSTTPVQCVQIVYLVRFDVKLNLNDENDVNLFLSECTKMLSRLYYMIGAGVYVSFLDAVQNLN